MKRFTNDKKYAEIFWTKLGGAIVRVRIRHGVVEIVVKRSHMRAVVPITPTQRPTCINIVPT